MVAECERHIVWGDPVKEILDFAYKIPADLIVMGTHGRSGFERLFLGSATEKVIRKATCPVLTICHATRGFIQLEPILSSTAHRVIIGADCPVLVVR